MGKAHSPRRGKAVPSPCVETARRRSVRDNLDHDLRQPLQTLRALHGVLAKKLRDEELLSLLAKCEAAVDAISKLLDAAFVSDALQGGNAPPQATNVQPETTSSAAGSVPPVNQSAPWAGNAGAATIFVVDDDSEVRDALRLLLEAEGRSVETYSNAEAFLLAYRPDRGGCLLVDAGLPGMNGFELLVRLKAEGGALPAIMITGQGDIPMAVQAIKAGAADFIEKPARAEELLASIDRALAQSNNPATRSSWQAAAETLVAALTKRERQVLDLVFVGHPNKEIAERLGVSQRTVETHRAAVMRKTGAKSLSALVRLVLAAT